MFVSCFTITVYFVKAVHLCKEGSAIDEAVSHVHPTIEVWV
jgi:hypothetical protein